MEQRVLFDISEYPCYDFYSDAETAPKRERSKNAKKAAPGAKISRSSRQVRPARVGETDPRASGENAEAI